MAGHRLTGTVVTDTRMSPTPPLGGWKAARGRWLALSVRCVSMLIVNLDSTVLKAGRVGHKRTFLAA
jgi:hypothetical protein